MTLSRNNRYVVRCHGASTASLCISCQRPSGTPSISGKFVILERILPLTHVISTSALFDVTTSSRLLVLVQGVIFEGNIHDGATARVCSPAQFLAVDLWKYMRVLNAILVAAFYIAGQENMGADKDVELRHPQRDSRATPGMGSTRKGELKRGQKSLSLAFRKSLPVLLSLSLTTCSPRGGDEAWMGLGKGVFWVSLSTH